MAQKAYSLSHTKWMCKYHIVFTRVRGPLQEEVIPAGSTGAPRVKMH